MDTSYEAMKEKLEEKTRDSGIFPTLLGLEHIPEESLGALGSNVSLEEFLSEMKRHGLEVSVSPRKKKVKASTPPPTAEELAKIPLSPEVEDTPENRARYAQMKDKAQRKLRDTGFIETVLETEQASQVPVDGAALEDLNTASYLGEYSTLRDLSKKLKPEDQKEEDS